MINLAGHRDADRYIRQELNLAGIPVKDILAKDVGEVPAMFCGELGAFTFHRAWRYWMVDGKVPLAVAQELYQTSIGKQDIRARGDAGCPSPEKVASWFTPDGRLLASLTEKVAIDRLIEAGYVTQEKIDKEFLFADPSDFSHLGDLYVPGYHIDSQEGLNLFVATLKKHGLV